MDVLNETYKSLFRDWLKRKCEFEILYSAMIGSFSEGEFHRSCDNTGPTVTLFWDKNHDNVFGGYTSQRWGCNNERVYDSEAFLFTLRLDGCFKPQRFPVKDPGNALLCNAKYGPIFGSEHRMDLCVYKEETYPPAFITRRNSFDRGEARGRSIDWQGRRRREVDRVEREKGVTMKIKIAMGNNYEIKSSQKFMQNGEIEVSTMKVYAVKGPILLQSITLLVRPWREGQEWDTNKLESLKEIAENYHPFHGSSLSGVNILLLGEVGSGKFSFVNSVESALRGKISAKAAAGVSESSYTTNFKRYRTKDDKGKPLNFRFSDTRGVRHESGLLSDDAEALMEGRIKNGYRFDPKNPIGTDVPEYISEPREKDKVHCLVYVVEGTRAENTPVSTINFFKATGQAALIKGIPRIVLLTKIDEMCDKTDDDLTAVFKSSVVLNAVKSVTAFTGLPMNHVLPVKNYHNEVETNVKVSILVMQALKQMLAFADDYLENLHETSSDDENVNTEN